MKRELKQSTNCNSRESRVCSAEESERVFETKDTSLSFLFSECLAFFNYFLSRFLWSSENEHYGERWGLGSDPALSLSMLCLSWVQNFDNWDQTMFLYSFFPSLFSPSIFISVKSWTPFANVVAAGDAVKSLTNGLFCATRRRLLKYTIIWPETWRTTENTTSYLFLDVHFLLGNP